MTRSEPVEVTVDQLLAIIGKMTVELEMLRAAHGQTLARIEASRQAP